MKSFKIQLGASAVVVTIGMSGLAQASSHREAPAIAEDQYADNTDVYSFISPSNPDNLVIVANYVPLLGPASGPNFYKFADSVRYEINVDNDGDAKPDVIFRYRFQTSVGNGDTFLYNTGVVDDLKSPNLNVKQTYRLVKVDKNENEVAVLGENLPVAPWHVGDRTFPDDTYEGVAAEAYMPAGNVTTFAGPRDEPFFVDLHVFDLLGVAGAPTTDGFNVMSLVLEVPITDLTKNGSRPAAGSTAKTAVLGVWATASRRQTTIIRKNRDAEYCGQFVQVSRLGWPLVNEVLIPLKDKDKYNRSAPKDDVSNFGAYILNPELPGLLNAVLGAGCAPTPAGGRVDLVGLLSPNGTTPADMQRINISQGQTFADSHFPNGRALEDDVVATELTVLCNSGSPLDDGVTANDLPFNDAFPYLATPHSGNPL